jgi:pimeloyl-ACP methyl ester carboxylesterase
VSALYAARHPDHVARLVLLAPLAPRAVTVRGAQQEEMRHLDTARLAALNAALQRKPTTVGDEELCRQFWSTFLPLYLGSSGRSTEAEHAMDATCRFPNESPRRFQATLQAVFGSAGDWNWLDEGRAVRAPTLIIQGDADLVAPATSGGEWAAVISDSRLLTIPGGGHLFLTEFPDSILPAIQSFVDGAWPPGARALHAPGSG